MTRANATKKDDDDVTDITCDAKKNEEERDPEEEAYEEIEEEVEVEYTTMDHISDFMNEVKEKRMEISRNCFSVVGEMTPTPEYLKSSRARGDATAELASLAVAAAAVVASKTARMNKEKKERCVKDDSNSSISAARQIYEAA